MDHNFTDKVRGTFRYIHDSWDQLYPTPLWTNGTSFPTIQTNFSGPGVSHGGPADCHCLAHSAERICRQLHHRPHHADSDRCLAASGQHDLRASSRERIRAKLPGISLGGGGVYNFGEDVGYLPNGPYNSNPTYTYRDNVTKIIGKHNLQFGGLLRGRPEK